MAKADKYMEEVIAKLLKEGVTEKELTAAKQGYLQEAKVNRSNDSTLRSYLQSNLHLGRNMKFYGDQESQVEKLTVPEVNSALAGLPGAPAARNQAGDFNKKKCWRRIGVRSRTAK